MFTIYDFYHDTLEKFEDWWDLIRVIYNRDLIDSIGHNYNDTFTSLEFGYNELYRKSYSRNLIVYDSLWRVVHITDIRDALKKFDPDKKKRKINKRWATYFEYRREPVPWISNHHSHYWRYNVGRNKSYAAKLQEYRKMFPCDNTIGKAINLVKSWDDDLSHRHVEKCWKTQSKKKKQWM